MAQIEPRTWSLESLIADVRGGRLRVPRFQRLFVWRAEQVLALLESVRLRYPIGTLFVWRTQERHSSFPRIGAIDLPTDSPPQGAEVGYVLDGHQRVSALVGTLSLRDDEAEALTGADRVFLVYYDLKARSFVHSQRPTPEQLPVRYVLPVATDPDGDPLTEWLEERREPHLRGSPERSAWDRYAREAYALRTSFAQYVVRVDDVKGASLAEALDIFVRVNTRGTPARPVEVFAALSYKPDGFDFGMRAREILSARPGFETVSTSVLLQALLCHLGLSAYERNWSDALQRHEHELPDRMTQVEEAFGRAVDFLSEPEQGARHARVLPYALQLVLLTSFFERAPTPTLAQKQALHRWFWSSSYGAIYGGTGSLSLDEHIARARQLAQGEHLDILPQTPPIQPLPQRFHPRSARVRAWHLFLATRRPLSLNTGEPVESPLREGLRDVRPLVPGESAWLLGARVLVGRLGGEPWRRLKAAQARDGFDRLLDSLVIPRESFDAALQGDWATFIRLRVMHMTQVERLHAAPYTTDLPDMSEPDPVDDPLIDVEEEDLDLY